jgi:hypothetical protein
MNTEGHEGDFRSNAPRSEIQTLLRLAFLSTKKYLGVDFQNFDCLLRPRLCPTYVSYEIDQARPSDKCSTRWLVFLS